MTLILFDGFAISARRSGEILELSANARPAMRRKKASNAVRAARLEYFREYPGMMRQLKARRPPKHKLLGMNRLHP